MPGSYDGRPGQITFEAPLTVTGATNTNPITVTVSGSLPAEFFLVGYGGASAAPLVDISDVQGNVAANGQFVATPTGASSFTIPVSGVGGGAYAGGGAVQPLYLKSQYTLPSDGDADNSASIASWGQATGDRTQWLASRIGAYKLAQRFVLVNDSMAATSWNNTANVSVSAGTWVPFLSGGGTLTANVGAPLSASLPYSFDGIVSGDLAHVTLRSHGVFGTGGSTSYGIGAGIGLWYANPAPAVVPAWPGGYAKIFASSALSPVAVSASVFAPFYCDGWVRSLGSGLFNLGIQVWTGPDTGARIYGLGWDAILQVDIWRPTGMPQ
jgi:hypothetical protein